MCPVTLKHSTEHTIDTTLQWSHIEQTSKSSIQEKKIRVLFLPADDASSTPARTNGISRDTFIQSSPPDAHTPQRDGTGSTQLHVDNFADSRDGGPSPANNSVTAGVQSAVATAATTVKNAIPSQADLQAQLNEAKAQIAKLTQQAGESSGLRQRKTDSTTDSKTPGATAVDTRQAPAGGVPIHITAGLCLVCFLLAYFLF